MAPAEHDHEIEKKDSRTVILSAAFAILSKFGVRIIGLISVALLARLLSPKDFGLVASATAVMGIFQTLALSGIKAVIVRERVLTNDIVDSGWSLGVVLSIFLSVVMSVIVGPLLSDYASYGAMLPVFIVLSFHLVIDAFENPGLFLLEREMKFQKILYLRVSVRTVTALVTISAAIFLRSYWALVIGILTYQSLMTVFSYRVSPYRPRISFIQWRHFARPSAFLVLGNFAKGFATSGDRILASRFMNASGLGQLAVARDLVRMTTLELSSALADVILPALSLQPDGQTASPNQVIKSINGIALIALPIGLGIFALAPPLTNLLLGDQWGEASSFVRILAIGGSYAAISEICAVTLIANLKERQNAYLELGHALLFTLFVLIALILFFPLAIALAIAILQIAFSLLRIGLLLRVLAVHPIYFIGPHVRCLISGLIMSGLLIAIWQFFSPVDGYALLLVPFGALTYISLVLGWWALIGCPQGVERDVWSFVVSHSRRNFSPSHQ